MSSAARSTRFAVLCGILAAALTVAASEVAALFIGSSTSPLFAVGSWVIDLTPGWLKDAVVAAFGTADKIVLFICLGILLVLLAALIGVLEYRRPPWGSVGLAVIAGIAMVAVLTRSGAGALSPLPTLIGAGVGVWALRTGIRRLHAWQDGPAPDARGVDRRSFLVFASVSAAAAVIAGTGARLVNGASTAVNSVRDALKLPRPATPAAAVPAGAELGIEGLSPYVTPNADFYRIDTALAVPSLDPSDWKLRVYGMVDHEYELSWKELLELPMTEHMLTLACVSNEVGGDLIGNALWLGYPLRELLKRAGPKAGADMVLSRSSDGFTASTPLDVLQDEGTDALLAIGMNGEPLPLEHGFPARLVVPGLYGYVSATKWVTELKVTTFAADQGYWTDKGWTARGPVKTESRIDTPRSGGSVRPGRVAVAGVAWAQHTGIAKVEVQVDDGSWEAATLADSVSADTWRQWVYPWDARAGRHTLRVRATDASGYTQTGATAPPAPDGATGWHEVTLTVA
ncbi:molybdopterin-dependent oxidoreductase [Rathayibacter sp. YIM 133350]|uniref:molybdopterin-dependent oxidoreductase n=1 Tax=Rathayibacter sp. YIM 133350 TaxID=3131992 RepID=UPI00307FC46A